MELSRKKSTASEYFSLPQGAPYQLIGGELTPSPAPSWKHQRISRKIGTRLSEHVENNGLGEVFFAPVDVYLSDENVFQPDLIFIAKGREDLLSDKGYIEGAPDLVAEILSPSTLTLDAIEKKEAYEKYGVKEYWIMDGESQTIYVYAMKKTGFELVQRVLKGESLSSEVVEGFALDTKHVWGE
ncbi:MAG: Uma2 family endonuclease [Spirochaetes bacterium]|nr:MAG: Uma2 family endonuclease [Spirochaetota bacterium]